MLHRLRKLAAHVRKTPLHPQWFAYRHADKSLREICSSLSGTVLDVGSAEGHPRRYLPADATYFAVDYYATASAWYGTQPDVYGDAQALPIVDDSVSHVLLLNVLEHLPRPDECLGEINRVLKRGGSLTIQVPFLYPIHDAPLDFHRWTRYGLKQAAARSGFDVISEHTIGRPIETAALNFNIALAKSILNWIGKKNPLAILILAAPPIVFLVNCLAWAFSALSPDDDIMPHAYQMQWIKSC